MSREAGADKCGVLGLQLDGSFLLGLTCPTESCYAHVNFGIVIDKTVHIHTYVHIYHVEIGPFKDAYKYLYRCTSNLLTRRLRLLPDAG